jgi:hypothetical protein
LLNLGQKQPPNEVAAAMSEQVPVHLLLIFIAICMLALVLYSMHSTQSVQLWVRREVRRVKLLSQELWHLLCSQVARLSAVVRFVASVFLTRWIEPPRNYKDLPLEPCRDDAHWDYSGGKIDLVSLSTTVLSALRHPFFFISSLACT